MEDRQVQTDAEEAAGGGETRRAGRRLSDTEAVATMRRDMFGDGSLLDVLAGSPPAPEGPPEPDPASLSAGDADPPPPDSAAAAEGPSPAPTGADAAPPASLAEVPQALDSIIDSFPPEPPGADPGASSAAADRGDAAHPSFGATPLPVSAIFRALEAMGRQEPEAQPAPDPAAPPGDPAAAAAPDGAEPGRVDELAAPSLDAAATAEAGEPEAPVPAAHGLELRNLLSPPFPAEANSPPHPDLDGVPPFLDGDGGPPYGQPSRMPQFAAPLELVVSNPEPVEAPAYPEDPPPYEEPAEAPREFPDFAPYPAPDDAADTVASPPPLLSSTASQATESAASPMFDAAAKIAAEANATAEALENLKRLLMQSVPAPEAPPAMNLRGEASPFVAGKPLPLLPLPAPPAEGPRKGIYLLGFLTGLGLSLMAGIALYFLIAMG
jgi:hypothetical protein